MKYDAAEFHDPDGNREEELTAAYIVLFLRWLEERGLIFDQLRRSRGDRVSSA